MFIPRLYENRNVIPRYLRPDTRNIVSHAGCEAGVGYITAYIYRRCESCDLSRYNHTEIF